MTLALTDDAVQAVRAILSSAPSAGEAAGIRITSQQKPDEEMGLQLALAEIPAEDDEVVEEGGARVFLEADAASYLDDKVLDAAVVGDRVHFSINPQG